MATSILNYVFSLIASRLLGPGDFGLLASAQSILLLAALVIQSGVPWTLARSVASAGAARNPIIRGSLVANLGIAGAVAAVVLLLYVGGPLQAALETPAVLAVVLVALPLFAVISIARASAQGLHRFGFIAVLQVTEVTTKTASGLALMIAGLGAAGAVAGFAAGGVAASLLGLAMLAVLGVRARGSRRLPAAGDVRPMFGTLLGLALVLSVDLLAVKTLLDDRAIAGHYQAAILLANAPYFLATSSLIPPLFTAAAAMHELPPTRQILGRALASALVLVVPFELLLIVAPEVVLGILFPPEYAATAPILRVMAVGNTLLMLAAMIAAVFQAVSRAGIPARVFLVLAAIEVPILVVAVPAGGAMAAVSIFAVVSGLAAVSLAGFYLREVRVDIGRVLRWVARLAAAVGVGLVVAVTVRAAAGAISAVVAAGLAYLGVATALRITPLVQRSGRRA